MAKNIIYVSLLACSCYILIIWYISNLSEIHNSSSHLIFKKKKFVMSYKT